MGATFLIVVVSYFSAVIGIAAWGFKRTRTEVDFLAAGRTIGPFVGGAVLAATQISAGTFVGTLGRHYQTGVSFFFVWAGVWCGWLISAIWVAPRLRAFGALTVPDYIGTRFNSEAARVLSAVLIIVCYTLYLVAQFLETMIMMSGLAIAIPVLLYFSGGPRVAWRFLADLDPRLTGMYYSWKQL